MSFWRTITADRYSGGVIAVLLLLTLVLQVVLAGPADAAMAGPTEIICTAHADDTHSPADPEHRQECPCSLLCQAGISVPAGLAPSEGFGLPIRFAERVASVREIDGAPADILLVRHRHARAPPTISIRS